MQGRHGAGDGVETAERLRFRIGSGLTLLCLLDLFPVAENLTGVDAIGLKPRGEVAGGGGGLVSKYVRMAADELAVQAIDNAGDGEVAGLGCHFGVEEYLEEQIAQLFFKVRPVAALDRIEYLVRLF